jgi:hypothetical protein
VVAAAAAKHSLSRRGEVVKAAAQRGRHVHCKRADPRVCVKIVEGATLGLRVAPRSAASRYLREWFARQFAAPYLPCSAFGVSSPEDSRRCVVAA